ncbi:MAG: TonB-dependent hemoglobin/transferrin/lactoferrin family receptor [Elioraea sp.]|nr:TonB-dependent hemoglobin/transferrin/lactoferrin family receptor [Elioraea sp.]
MTFRAALLCSVVLLPGLAAAQSAPRETPLDAIQTEATRTPQAAGDVAAPVTVLRREDLLRRQPANINDLLSDIPGAEADGLPRNTVMQPQIRGLGDERVIVRLDGVRQNFNSGHRGRLFLDPELLREATVLRGPASMLYGSGALGGVFSLRTIEADDVIRPGHATGAILGFGYDTNGSRFRLSALGAARAGGFDVVGGIVRRTGQGLTDAAGTTIPFTDQRTLSGLLRTGWEAAPGLRLSLSALQFREDGLMPVAANTITTTNIADRDLTQTQFAFDVRYAPPGNPWLDMRATLYRNLVEIEERRVVPADNRRDGTKLETIGLDIQNTARFTVLGAERNALTFGLEVYRDEQIGSRNGAPRPQYPNAEQTVLGVFVQNELTLGAVTVTGGLRFDRFDQSAQGQPGRDFSRLSPRISLAWQVTPWLQPYVSYAEAYRSPALTELYNAGVHFPIQIFPPLFNVFVPNPNLRPETARNAEIGANLRFRDVLTEGDSLRIRVSAFNNNLSDFIETVVMATTTEQRNVTRARIRGVEAEAFYDSGAWFAGLGASALQGDNRVTGEPLSLIPAHKLSLSLGRRFEETGLVLGGRVLLAAEQDRKPRDPATNQPARPTGGYATLDLFLSWQPPEGALDGWRLDIGATNVLGARYRRLSWDAGSTPAPFYEVGRNIRFAVRRQF